MYVCMYVCMGAFHSNWSADLKFSKWIYDILST